MKSSIVLFATLISISCLRAQNTDNMKSYVSYNNVTSTRNNSFLYESFTETNNSGDENALSTSKKDVSVKTDRKRVRIGNFSPEASEAEITYTPVSMIATAFADVKESTINFNSTSKKVANIIKAVDMNSNNNFHISYSLINKGKLKYSFHIEGRVKDCSSENKIPHAYISVNSAVTKDKYEIIPTNMDGHFSIDIDDDSIGSITVIKKGYEDKEIALQNVSVNENTSYGFEVCMEKTDDGGNNILAATETVSKAGQLYFDFNKTNLKKETTDLLDNLISNIKSTSAKSTTIEINGYADSKGSKDYNLQLSKARSIACKNYIVKHGVKNVKIKINALGATPFGVKDEEEATRAKNRRVDILIHSRHKGYTGLS